jgi:hypothetical protein
MAGGALWSILVGFRSSAVYWFRTHGEHPDACARRYRARHCTRVVARYKAWSTRLGVRRTGASSPGLAEWHDQSRRWPTHSRGHPSVATDTRPCATYGLHNRRAIRHRSGYLAGKSGRRDSRRRPHRALWGGRGGVLSRDATTTSTPRSRSGGHSQRAGAVRDAALQPSSCERQRRVLASDCRRLCPSAVPAPSKGVQSQGRHRRRACSSRSTLVRTREARLGPRLGRGRPRKGGHERELLPSVLAGCGTFRPLTRFPGPDS